MAEVHLLAVICDEMVQLTNMRVNESVSFLADMIKPPKVSY